MCTQETAIAQARDGPSPRKNKIASAGHLLGQPRNSVSWYFRRVSTTDGIKRPWFPKELVVVVVVVAAAVAVACAVVELLFVLGE